MISAEREAALAIEQEKDAIIDLVKDGYDKQIASLETLSSKYMEALNAEKDLYDYQKNIQKQTKDILTLRKRIASLQGDTSEEARSRRQQLQVQLKDAPCLNQSIFQNHNFSKFLPCHKYILP